MWPQTLSLLPGFLGGGPENAAALVDDRWLHGMASLACLGLPIVGAYVMHVAFELPLLWREGATSGSDREALPEVGLIYSYIYRHIQSSLFAMYYGRYR